MAQIKPFFWSLVNTGGSQLIAFAATMVIARVASPADFGVFAIGSAIILICNVLAEAGFTSTIIYDEDFSEPKASTILWLSVAAACFLFCVIWLTASPIADYFADQRLRQILPFMALSTIGTSFGVVHAALITRNLQFDKKAVLALSTHIISIGVGLPIALSGYPLFGLAAIFALTPILLSATMWIFAPWRVQLVCWPHLIGGDIGYAGNIVFSGLLDQANKSCIMFFLGQRYGVATLGYFNRAEAIKNIAGQTINKAVQRVSFPVLTKARRDDFSVMLENHINITLALLTVLLPFVWFVQKFAADLIFLLFGPNWSSSAPMLEIVVIGAIFMPLISLNMTLLKSNGRTAIITANKAVALACLLVFFLVIPKTDIEIILQAIVGFFAFQYFISLISMLQLPDFIMTQYVFSVLAIVLATLSGMLIYEAWAGFHFTGLFMNLLSHGVAMLATVTLINWFGFQFMRRGS